MTDYCQKQKKKTFAQQPTERLFIFRQEQTHKPLKCAHKPLKRAHKPLKRAHRPHKRAHKPLKRAHKPLKRAHKPLKRAHKPLKCAHRPLKRAHKPLKRAHKPHKWSYPQSASLHDPAFDPAANHLRTDHRYWVRKINLNIINLNIALRHHP